MPERPCTVGVVGLGNMGLPMMTRLVRAGHRVRGHDVSAAARTAFEQAGGASVDRLTDVATDADLVILMLPSSAVVEQVVDADGLLEALRPGTVLVDMGSSEPLATRALAERTAARGVPLVDAPVSGGVSGARAGTLTIMVGGADADVTAVCPVLQLLGSRVRHVGPTGAGHALKALNNLMSATHLLISSEALLAGRAFGLDPEVMLEVVNGSSGRSGSTQSKWPDFVLTGSYDSGFGLGLMLKDMRIAVGLAIATGSPIALGEAAAALWSEAADRLPVGADHTEIVRWLEGARV